MSSYLKTLREKSKNSIEEKSKQIDDSKKTSYGDDRFWKLTVDKNGNGEAVIRFLPPMDGESVAWVDKYNHSFQGPTGQWFIENCPTTIGGNCPVCDANRIIWRNNSKEEAQKKTLETKRIHKYYSNILVVDDPANSENNGKVFLYEFGPRIFAKIEEAIKPISSRQKPIDPFDIDRGANFILLAKTVSKQRNYDSSSFESPSPISDDDDTIDKILGSLFSLQSLVSKENFKSFDDLQRSLDRAEGRGVTVRREFETESEDSFLEERTSNGGKEPEFSGSLKDLDLDEIPF
jgi:hypothetical protein